MLAHYLNSDIRLPPRHIGPCDRNACARTCARILVRRIDVFMRHRWCTKLNGIANLVLLFEICKIGENVLPMFLKKLSTQGTPMPAPASAASPCELNDGDSMIPDVSSQFKHRTPEENEQIKSYVGKWFASGPRFSLLVTAICVRPFTQCFHALIRFGHQDWVTEQQAKVINGDQGLFRSVEAYKGNHVKHFFDDVYKLLKLDL